MSFSVGRKAVGRSGVSETTETKVVEAMPAAPQAEDKVHVVPNLTGIMNRMPEEMDVAVDARCRQRIAIAGAKAGNQPCLGSWNSSVVGGWMPHMFMSRGAFAKLYRKCRAEMSSGELYDAWMPRAGGFVYLYTEGPTLQAHPEGFTTLPCAKDLAVWVGNNLVTHPNGKLWSDQWTESLRVTPEEFERLTARVKHVDRWFHVRKIFGYQYYQDFRGSSTATPVAFSEIPAKGKGD